jgi:hypothetical protein
MSRAYRQLGFVTNNFDRAIALVREAHAIGPFNETHDLTIGARGADEVTAHFGLAFVDGAQIEIIQPLSGDVAFYGEALVTNDFAIQLHHKGRYFPDPVGYEAAHRRLSARWPLAVDHHIYDGSYCYFDARADMGHYLELFCFPPETHFAGVPRYVSESGGRHHRLSYD